MSGGPITRMAWVLGFQTLSAAALAVIFFIDSAMVGAAVTLGFLIVMLLFGFLGIRLRKPFFLYTYMFVCVVWVIIGVLHLMLILGVAAPFANMKPIVGKSVNQWHDYQAYQIALSAYNAAIASPTTSNSKSAALTVQQSVGSSSSSSNFKNATSSADSSPVDTGGDTLPSSAVARRRLVRRQLSGSVPIVSSGPSSSSTTRTSTVSNSNALDASSSSSTPSINTTTPSQTSAWVMTAPIYATIDPIFYGVHLWFLSVGFVAACFLPLVNDSNNRTGGNSPYSGGGGGIPPSSVYKRMTMNNASGGPSAATMNKLTSASKAAPSSTYTPSTKKSTAAPPPPPSNNFLNMDPYSTNNNTPHPKKKTGLGAMQVIKRYEPALNDELSLEIGEWVEVEEVFDDGWGVGVNLETAQYGAFPMDSLQQDKKKSGKRVQSMVASRAAAANGGGIMGTLGEYTTGVYDYLGWSSK